MPYWKRLSSFSLSLVLAVLVTFGPLSRPIVAQQQGSQTAATAALDLSAPLAAIEKTINDKRMELGIPGASLVIVKDDKIIFIKGFGFRDLEKKLPATPDTLFAIGSSSKAFTALSAVMAADEGKLSLEDSPKKFLPYFKMRDPDTDAKITLRDLLSHRSGLNRTDLAMVTGVLNRQELIQVAGMAKPTAKLGEKFQYQNVMYAAAGEVVAQVEHSTWDQLMAKRIFKPLEMKSSDTTAAAMQKSRDFSFGYTYNATTKETRRLPQREITAAAPAGAINSNARDMAQWLRFMLAGGVFNGKRLVSEKGFNELVTKQMNVAGSVNYGLGWFLREWNGHKVVEHGGNIDGFNAQVAFMPDQKLGFVLLTNVTASPLGGFAMNTIWSNLVARPEAAAVATSGPAVDPNSEVGFYKLVAAGVNFEVSMKDGKLTLIVPGQPPYAMENVGGRHYKMADPTMTGFSVTFRPIKGNEADTEMFLEQPQGNLVLPKVKPGATAESSSHPAAESSGSVKDAIGAYENEQKVVIEVGEREGRVSLVVPGQPPYPLVEKEKNKLVSPALPPSYWIEITRNADETVSGIVVNQPEGKFAFRRMAATSAPITTDELIAKMIVAYGGEQNLRRHKSSVIIAEIDLANQGVLGETTVYAKAPNLNRANSTLVAGGKKIGTVVSYFDGTGGGEFASFSPGETYSGKHLEDVRLGSDFYDVLNWKQNFKTITFKRVSKIGDEDVYVIELTPEKGHPITEYVSTKSYLALKKDSVISDENSGIELPQTEVFSDYRLVDGVMIPFRVVSNNVANGDVITTIKSVKFDVEIPDTVFRKPLR